mgnify:CR=1 FL=1
MANQELGGPFGQKCKQRGKIDKTKFTVGTTSFFPIRSAFSMHCAQKRCKQSLTHIAFLMMPRHTRHSSSAFRVRTGIVT